MRGEVGARHGGRLLMTIPFILGILVGVLATANDAETVAANPGGQMVTTPVSLNAAAEPAVAPDPTALAVQGQDRSRVDDLLKMDLDQLASLPVRTGTPITNLTAPSNQLPAGAVEHNDATTTGELLNDLPGVSTRRTSAVNLDPRVRGYHSSQLSATANGMTELKTRLDIDSAFSQIDPGIIKDVTVIDGPYSSLYGPAFAFIDTRLASPPRYANGPESHASTTFTYGNNGQTIYTRESGWSGGKDWGAYFSFGLRSGGDYYPGNGSDVATVPAGYQKWDTFFSFSRDLNASTRVEFDFLRTEMNNVELPGIVYDINNSRNEQFNLRYVVQADRQGPEDFVVQTWHHQTSYQGDALRASKQTSFYSTFITQPTLPDSAVNTLGAGHMDSLGVRILRTFGETDAIQWTIGTDWRRYEQVYRERDVNASGSLIFDGNVFGIPLSTMNDIGVLTNLDVPLSEEVSMTVGGRADCAMATLDRYDPVVTAIDNPSGWYYAPGYDQPQQLLGMGYMTGKVKLSENYTLNMGTGYAMRMPDLTELYCDDPYVPLARLGNSYVSGNSALRPERNWQADLGLTWRREKASCGVRGFYSTINDYIMPVPAFIDPAVPDSVTGTWALKRNFQYFPASQRLDLGGPNENADASSAGYQYANVDLVVMCGGDLFGEVQVLDWLSLYGSVDYVQGINFTPVAYLAGPSMIASEGTLVPLGFTEGLPGLYPLSSRLAARFFDPDTTRDRWGIEFSSRLVHAQDYVAVSLSELHTPGFAVFNVHGYYRWNKHLRSTLAIENLLNTDYYESGSLVIDNSSGIPTFVREAGTTVLLGVEAHF